MLFLRLESWGNTGAAEMHSLALREEVEGVHVVAAWVLDCSFAWLSSLGGKVLSLFYEGGPEMRERLGLESRESGTLWGCPMGVSCGSRAFWGKQGISSKEPWLGWGWRRSGAGVYTDCCGHSANCLFLVEPEKLAHTDQWVKLRLKVQMPQVFQETTRLKMYRFNKLICVSE